jgi:phage-related minor tail protein
MSLDDGDADDLAATLSGQATLVRDLEVATQRMGRTIASAFARGAVEGRRFEDVLRSVALRLSQGLLSQSLTPLANGLTGLLSQGFGALFGGVGGGASGGASGRVIPFAQGGVVAAPTYFGFGGGELGLMGERGAEAILPLQRGPDGRLGVSAGGADRPISVSVTIATPDMAGFRRSEAEVSATIARAVARGRRAL